MVRSSADRFVELTDVPGIRPERYPAWLRWITVIDVRTFPADYLQVLVEGSYYLAAGTRPPWGVATPDPRRA